MKTKLYLNTSNIESRTRDVITNSEDLEYLYSFKGFPVQLCCTDSTPVDDIYADMEFYISKSSGCIQLGSLIEPTVLYKSGHAAGTVGNIWDMHHKEFADFINSFRPQNIIEIGGGNGQLFNKFNNKYDFTSWTIIEPNPVAKPSPKLEIIPEFFNQNSIFDCKYDMVVHSHTLEHMYNPVDFLESINSKLLKSDGFLCFSVPDIDNWFSNKYTNAINFEHTYLINDVYIKYILSLSGYKIISKKKFGDGHSTFYAAKKTSESMIGDYQSINGMYSRNYELAANYKFFLENEIDKLNESINLQSGEIYIFGAHVFTQTLISLGLETKKISSILDNSPQKHNLRLYGTDLLVRNPIFLNKVKKPTVIIRAGVYESEIKIGLLKLNENISFI